MVVIEIFVYVYIMSMMIVCVSYLKKSGILKKSDVIYFYVLFSLIVSQILVSLTVPFLSFARKQDSILLITPICLGTIFALVLIYMITRVTVSSVEIREDARVWIGWMLFWVVVLSICAILIGLPQTHNNLYRMPIVLALCVGMKYYPSVLDRISIYRETTQKQTAEKRMEGYKGAIVNSAVESWRVAKVFERALEDLNTADSRRYTSQLRWFVKQTEENIEDIGLRFVNIEGLPYDPGMKVNPVNIDKFEVDDVLEVDFMLEPIIMEGTVLVRPGKITLRRIE